METTNTGHPRLKKNDKTQKSTLFSYFGTSLKLILTLLYKEIALSSIFFIIL